MTEFENSNIAAEETVDVTEETVAKKVHDMSKEEMVAELRNIVTEKRMNAHKEVAALKQALFAIRQREINDELDKFVEEGNDPTAFSASVDALESESKDLIAKFKEMRTKYLEEEQLRLEKNLARKREILAEMQAIVEDADNVNMNFPKFQELQQAFKDGKDVTPSAEAEIWRNYQNTVEQYYDTLKINKELRDLDFKKNLELKQRLIEQAVALAAEENIIEASASLRRLHDEWREIGPVMKDLRDSIWEEFKAASAVINKKHQEYFDAIKERELKNEEAKTALCEQIEAIDYSAFTRYSEWDEASEKIRGLQAEWKNLGFASRKKNAELYARFRKVCDEFFKAKSEFNAERREELQVNLQKKLDLIAKAEEIAANPEMRHSIDAVLKLQAEWKSIGAVPRKQRDSIWEKFTSVCTSVFEANRARQSERLAEQNANLEAKRAIIEKLKSVPLEGEVKDTLRIVRELQKEWQGVGHVPMKKKDKIQAEYREICDAIYGSISERRDAERRQNFEGQLTELKGDGKKMRSERDRLKRVLEQKQSDLATYKNNLGFFNVKSSAGNSMVKEMEKKMARIEADIREIKEKIKMLAD
ncbi:MAG: DUF349 domain-containing protein [Muribaculaceae bacterium]|nr:DUF349 domain-containing protein [Muribaculaceae bacterium]